MFCTSMDEFLWDLSNSEKYLCETQDFINTTQGKTNRLFRLLNFTKNYSQREEQIMGKPVVFSLASISLMVGAHYIFKSYLYSQ